MLLLMNADHDLYQSSFLEGGERCECPLPVCQASWQAAFGLEIASEKGFSSVELGRKSSVFNVFCFDCFLHNGELKTNL